jgi:glutathione S-transferase
MNGAHLLIRDAGILRLGVMPNLQPFKTITRYFVSPASHHTYNFLQYEYRPNLSLITYTSRRTKKKKNYRPIFGKAIHNSATQSTNMVTTNASKDEAVKPKVTLFWLNQSRAQRIVWLLEELGLDYDLEIYRRVDKLAPANAKEIHPLGKFPVVKVNDDLLAESGFITEYLVDNYGEWLKPKDRASLMRYKYFLHYAEGSFMPPLIVGVVMQGVRSAPVPFFLKPFVNMICSGVETKFLLPNYKTHFDFLESEISERPWLAGEEFTGADILLSFPLTAMKGKSIFTQENYPRLWAYTEKLTEREAYKKAAKKTETMEGEKIF